MKKILIILSVFITFVIIISIVFLADRSLSPTSTPAQTQTGASLLPNPPSPFPSQESPFPTLNSELRTFERLIIPPGFRLPDSANLKQKTQLELILPGLIPDPQTKRLNELDLALLHFHLSQSYLYDPAKQNIVADANYHVITSIIDFGTFDPENFEVQKNKNVLFFNQNTVACKLRTNPKSPERINQTIDSQRSIIIKLTTSGTYILYCQDKPENTQTIIVL